MQKFLISPAPDKQSIARLKNPESPFDSAEGGGLGAWVGIVPGRGHIKGRSTRGGAGIAGIGGTGTGGSRIAGTGAARAGSSLVLYIG